MIRSHKRYGQVALLMAGILAASVLLTIWTGAGRLTGKEGKGTGETFRIVASFYPVYVAALNVTGGVDGVEVESLTGPTAGCLHEYQLSPDNRILLSRADALVINGAGAESFLDQVIGQLPELPVVDTSAGVSLRESGEEDHDHEGHTHAPGEELVNEHIWTSPARYRRQVENLRDGLCRLDPDNASKYADNARAYLADIDAIDARLKTAASGLPLKACITFHDSLAYMAEDWGLTVAAALSMGEESGVSAADLKRAESAAAEAGGVLLLYDSQYPVEYAYVGDSADRHEALVLRTGVTGAAEKSAWLDAMTYNLRLLEKAGAPR